MNCRVQKLQFCWGVRVENLSPKNIDSESGKFGTKEVITSEREARSEFLLIYTKNLSMSGRPAGPPAARGYAFERLISLEL